MATDSLQIFGTSYTGVTGIKATDSSNGTKTYIRPQGTKSITANGTGIDVSGYSTVDVSVSGSGVDCPVFTITRDSSTNEITTITCNKSHSECYTLNQNSAIEAILVERYWDGGTQEEEFIGGNVAIVSADNRISYDFGVPIPYYRIMYYQNGNITWQLEPISYRSSSDLTSSNLTVTAPSGYYSSNATKTLSDANLVSGNIVSGVTIFGVTGNASTGVDCPVFTILNGGASVTCNKTYAECMALINASNTSAVFYMPDADDYIAGAAFQNFGNNTIEYYGDLDIIPMVKIVYAQNGTITYGLSNLEKYNSDLTASNLTVTVPSGYYRSNATKTLSDANLVAGNIKSGTTIFGVTGSYSGGGSSKNIQYYMGRDEVSATSYTATDLSITVSKAGTYKCYWVMDRNTTSGTSGSRLYKNDASVGTAHTSWTYNNNNRNGMNCEETLTLAANDVLVVRARSRSTSYICGVSNLIIVEQ